MTPQIRLKNDTFADFEWTGPFYPRFWDHEEFGDRPDRITLLHLVLHDAVLFVEMEVTLTDVVGRSPRRHE